VEEYKIYLAQALYKAGCYAEATRAALRVDDPQYSQRLLMLQAAIKYEEDEVSEHDVDLQVPLIKKESSPCTLDNHQLSACKSLVDQCIRDDPDTIINYACITYKEGNFEDARTKFVEAINTLGYRPELAYNIALCHYCQKQFGPALKYISEIIEKGVREHPELSVGSNTDGIEVRWVCLCSRSKIVCSHHTVSWRAYNGTRCEASATPRFCGRQLWWRRSTSKLRLSTALATQLPPRKP